MWVVVFAFVELGHSMVDFICISISIFQQMSCVSLTAQFLLLRVDSIAPHTEPVPPGVQTGWNDYSQYDARSIYYYRSKVRLSLFALVHRALFACDRPGAD